MRFARTRALVVAGLLGAAAVHAQSPPSGTAVVRVLGQNGPMPARITVVDAQGALAPVQAAADPILAIRPGVVYTATGEARLQLPDGEYTVWASRGVEYDAQSRTIRVAAGGPDVALDLRLTRAFQIPGWAAGDVHVHTLERSGHGDATLLERP